MPNGATARVRLRLVEPAPIKTTVPSDVERAIGDLVADAAISVCAGFMDWTNGGQLHPSTRTRAGGVFVKLYELQEGTAIGEEEFHTIAKREGKRVLIARLLSADATFDGAAADAEFDEILSWHLEVLAEVTAKEREYQRTRTH
jgi:hypothetical protein